MLALLLVALTPKEPLLLHKSTLITHVAGWRESQFTVGLYHWWTTEEFVAILDDTRQVLVNARTKKRTAFSVDKAVTYAAPNLSPDRKWVIDQQWEGQTITWRVLDSRSGKVANTWSLASKTPRPGRSSYTGYWSPVVQWAEDGKSIYQIESIPTGNHLKYLITKRNAADPSVAETFPQAFCPWETYVIVQRGKAMRLEIRPASPSIFRISEWALSDPSTVSNYAIHAPRNLKVLSYIPSPDSRRALWVMGESGAKPITDEGYPYRSVSIWWSGLHGEAMTEVGLLPFSTEDPLKQQDRYQRLGGIQWNPDSKRFSFIYDRKLYLCGT